MESLLLEKTNIEQTIKKLNIDDMAGTQGGYTWNEFTDKLDDVVMSMVHGHAMLNGKKFIIYPSKTDVDADGDRKYEVEGRQLTEAARKRFDHDTELKKSEEIKEKGNETLLFSWMWNRVHDISRKSMGDTDRTAFDLMKEKKNPKTLFEMLKETHAQCNDDLLCSAFNTAFTTRSDENKTYSQALSEALKALAIIKSSIGNADGSIPIEELEKVAARMSANPVQFRSQLELLQSKFPRRDYLLSDITSLMMNAQRSRDLNPVKNPTQSSALAATTSTKEHQIAKCGTHGCPNTPNYNRQTGKVFKTCGPCHFSSTTPKPPPPNSNAMSLAAFQTSMFQQHQDRLHHFEQAEERLRQERLAYFQPLGGGAAGGGAPQQQYQWVPNNGNDDISVHSNRP